MDNRDDATMSYYMFMDARLDCICAVWRFKGRDERAIGIVNKAVGLEHRAQVVELGSVNQHEAPDGILG
jgi:hypothetical protein